MQMDRDLLRAIHRADLFVSIGTSGAVYPAAGFVREARGQGVRTLELNLEPSQGSHWFDEARHGPATRIGAGMGGGDVSRLTCRNSGNPDLGQPDTPHRGVHAVEDMQLAGLRSSPKPASTPVASIAAKLPIRPHIAPSTPWVAQSSQSSGSCASPTKQR